jgi:hypothetical protein
MIDPDAFDLLVIILPVGLLLLELLDNSNLSTPTFTASL